jgi:transcriptional regulator with XRE-family HTH domain
VSSDERAAPARPEVPSAHDESGPRAVGQYLANQRRLRRISLEELSERTRIPRRNLERLESGAFDAQADGFTRGFVRTVAEALGLDASEAVMRLVGEPRADEERALRAARRAMLWRVGLLAGGAALALGALAFCATRLATSPPDAAPASVTYRRDAVRGLAESTARAHAAPGEPGPSQAQRRER